MTQTHIQVRLTHNLTHKYFDPQCFTETQRRNGRRPDPSAFSLGAPVRSGDLRQQRAATGHTQRKPTARFFGPLVDPQQMGGETFTVKWCITMHYLYIF